MEVQKMGIEIVKFRKFEKNTLKGFLTILMTNIGLEIRDCTVHQKDGKRWVGLPAKPYEKEDGTTAYSYVIKFVDKNKYFQFQEAFIKELSQYLKKQNVSTPGQGENYDASQDIPF
jgi:hypothetical protein